MSAALTERQQRALLRVARRKVRTLAAENKALWRALLEDDAVRRRVASDPRITPDLRIAILAMAPTGKERI